MFELEITVGPEHIDQLGHVNNVTYVQWVQDVAIAHWSTVASPADQEKYLWIVLRHEIDYKQAARIGEELIARTWVGNATRLRFERHTEILRNGVVLAKALTVWCPVDKETKRPVPVNAEVRAAFSDQTNSNPANSDHLG